MRLTFKRFLYIVRIKIQFEIVILNYESLTLSGFSSSIAGVISIVASVPIVQRYTGFREGKDVLTVLTYPFLGGIPEQRRSPVFCGCARTFNYEERT